MAPGAFQSGNSKNACPRITGVSRRHRVLVFAAFRLVKPVTPKSILESLIQRFWTVLYEKMGEVM